MPAPPSVSSTYAPPWPPTGDPDEAPESKTQSSHTMSWVFPLPPLGVSAPSASNTDSGDCSARAAAAVETAPPEDDVLGVATPLARHETV